ncbi:MAG: SRPBCC family protein, partial [Nitrospirota bacterium]
KEVIMPEIKESIVIKSPVSKVFELVTNPANWSRYVTNLVDVKGMSPDIPARGSTFTYQYKMMGFKFEGKGTVTENVKDKSFSLSFESVVPIKEGYEFLDRGNSTEFFFYLEFGIPGPMGAIFDNRLIEKLSVMDAKNILEKIKAMCEWS